MNLGDVHGALNRGSHIPLESFQRQRLRDGTGACGKVEHSSVDLLFGENDRGLLPEFAQAQSHSCGVSVFYSQGPGSFPLITLLEVYSPSDSSTVSNDLTWPLLSS